MSRLQVLSRPHPYLSLSLREDRQLEYCSRQPLWEKQITDLTERSCLVHWKAEVQNLVKLKILRKNSDGVTGCALCLFHILVTATPIGTHTLFKNLVQSSSACCLFESHFISRWFTCPCHLISICPPRHIPREGLH